MGNRLNAVIGEALPLTYNFYKNGVLVNADNFDKVEIYKVVELDRFVLEHTLYSTSGEIILTSTGVYTYTIPDTVFTSSGEYFDRVFIFPEPTTSSPFTDDSKIKVRNFDLEFDGQLGAPVVDVCRIRGRILDISGNPISGSYVVANISDFPATVTGTTLLLTQNPVSAFTNDLGFYFLDVMRNAKCRIFNKDTLLDIFVLIPDAADADVSSLAPTQEIGDITNDALTGEDDW